MKLNFKSKIEIPSFNLSLLVLVFNLISANAFANNLCQNLFAESNFGKISGEFAGDETEINSVWTDPDKMGQFGTWENLGVAKGTSIYGNELKWFFSRLSDNSAAVVSLETQPFEIATFHLTNSKYDDIFYIRLQATREIVAEIKRVDSYDWRVTHKYLRFAHDTNDPGYILGGALVNFFKSIGKYRYTRINGVSVPLIEGTIIEPGLNAQTDKWIETMLNEKVYEFNVMINLHRPDEVEYPGESDFITYYLRVKVDPVLGLILSKIHNSKNLDGLMIPKIIEMAPNKILVSDDSDQIEKLSPFKGKAFSLEMLKAN